jgi:C_GCAxxG_C_C family probable redox protein
MVPYHQGWKRGIAREWQRERVTEMSSSRSTDDIVAELHKKVEEHLQTSGNCAQTSFLALQEVLALEGGSVLKALTPFPGIALRGETCGAVTGSLMALGLVFGRNRENLNDYSAYQSCLRPSRKFCRAVEDELGSTMCGDIIEKRFGRRYNLANPVESMEWMGLGAIEKCAAVISTSVAIAARIIVAEEQ